MASEKKIMVYPGWSEANYFKELYKGSAQITYASYDGAWFNLLKNKQLHRPDVIHLHWLTAYFALDLNWSISFVLRYLISLLDILLLSFFGGTKIVYTAHNLYEHETKHESLERFCKKLVCRLADSIIVLGPSAKDLIVETYKVAPEKVEVSWHGNFNKVFPEIENSKEECRAAHKLPNEKKIYLFPGVAKRYKGIVELVQTFKTWNNPNAVLVIAGKVSNEVMSELGKLPTNIRLINQFVPNEAFAELYKASDWIVLPYQRILTSATLLTSMGFGKAIITPKIGTLGDYLDTNGGIFYEANKKNALLSALESSINADELELGKYNKKKALTFAWQKISTETFEILNRN